MSDKTILFWKNFVSEYPLTYFTSSFTMFLYKKLADGNNAQKHKTFLPLILILFS